MRKLMSVVACGSVLGLAGCLGDTEVNNDPITTTLTGEVVDAKSGVNRFADPVEGAAVTLEYGAIEHTAMTDENGRFVFEGIPFSNSGSHRITIEAPEGYMDWYGIESIDVPDTRAATIEDIGQISLAPAHEVRVQVVDENGAMTAEDAQVYAMETGSNGLCANYRNFGNQDYLVDTENGEAVFDVSACANLMVMVPAHGDSEDLPSAYMTSTAQTLNFAQNASEMTIVAPTAEPEASPTIIAANLGDQVGFHQLIRIDENGDRFMGASPAFNPAASHGEDLRVVFNFPVEVLQGPQLRFDDMASDDFPMDAEVLSMANYELTANNTILIISPDWGVVPALASVDVNMELAATGVDSFEYDESIHIAEPGLDTSIIALVNEEEDDAIAANVSLVLPNYMEGGVTVTAVNGEDRFRNLEDLNVDEIVYVESGCGDHCGPEGRSTRIDLASVGPLAAGDEVTLYLNLRDMFDNEIREEFDLTVNE